MGAVNSDLMAQLAPAHAAPPPGLWPLAPGWWLLMLLSLTAIAALCWWMSRPARRLRRFTLRELQDLERAGGDDVELARKLENLLRRYAIARFGRDRVARLSGEHWLAFVVARGGKTLAGEPGRQLLRAAYGAAAQPDRARWLSGARGFIRSRA